MKTLVTVVWGLLIFLFTAASATAGVHPKDEAELLSGAAVTFYYAEPHTVKSSGDGYDFIFFARDENADPRAEENQGDYPASDNRRVVCAHKSSRGVITLKWIYALPAKGMALLWWPAARTRQAFFVALENSTCLLVDEQGDEHFSIIKKFTYRVYAEAPYLFQKTFAVVTAPLSPAICYEGDSIKPALYTFDIKHDCPVLIWKSRRPGDAHYLADGLQNHGNQEIVTADAAMLHPGESARSTLRLWRFEKGRFRQVSLCASIPGRWPQSGQIFHIAGRRSAHFLTRESNRRGDVNLACLYECKGNKLRRLASTRGLLQDKLSGFIPVDLDGIGTDQVVAVRTEGQFAHQFHRIVILRYAKGKFKPAWQSPALTYVTLARPMKDHGQTVIPLMAGMDPSGLLRRKGGTYAGWEAFAYHAPPPPRPVPLADRLSVTQDMMQDPMPVYFEADGEKLIRFHATKGEPNWLVLSRRLSDAILGYASKRVPPSSVTSRVVTVHDEIEGDSSHAEVRVGGDLFLSLAPEDAKTYGGTLAGVAARWRDAVRRALTILETPKTRP